MNFWQTLLVAAVPSLAAVLTAAIGVRDLGLRRRLESSRQFVNLFAAAHGRPADGREAAGVGEQIASVYLIADFARREALVYEAARQGLSYLATEWQTGESDSMRRIGAAAEAALPRLGDRPKPRWWQRRP